MRTSNPALNEKAFSNIVATGTDHMTIEGTANKTGILFLLVILSATISWNSGPLAGLLAVVGSIGGFGVALVTIFKKDWAMVTAPLYALLEGLFLGAVSSMYESVYDGIVFQAVGLTFGTTACLLAAYMSGAIKATENFKLGVIAATGGIAIFYLVSIVLNLIGFGVPAVFGNGIIGIAFSFFVVAIAALNLVLDFDFIEQGAASSLPKYMEWYGAFGLMVTLVWLYLEILRLVAKLRNQK